MSLCHHKCRFTACSCLGVGISILVGAVVGVLFAFGLIPFITTIVWVVFGLAVLTLIFLVAGIFLSATGCCKSEALQKCTIRNTPCLLAGIIGTIISAIIALSIVLTPALIVVIVFIAILGFFFSLMIIGLIAYLSCITCELD